MSDLVYTSLRQIVGKHKLVNSWAVNKLFYNALIFDIDVNKRRHCYTYAAQPLVIIELSLNFISKSVIIARFVVNLLDDDFNSAIQSKIGVSTFTFTQ